MCGPLRQPLPPAVHAVKLACSLSSQCPLDCAAFLSCPAGGVQLQRVLFVLHGGTKQRSNFTMLIEASRAVLAGVGWGAGLCLRKNELGGAAL